jgi:hypothetical protein
VYCTACTVLRVLHLCVEGQLRVAENILRIELEIGLDEVHTEEANGIEGELSMESNGYNVGRQDPSAEGARVKKVRE